MDSTLRVSCISCLLLIAASIACPGEAAEAGGARVQLHEYEGPAEVSLESPGKHQLRIDVDPKGDRRPLVVRVDLAETGRLTWPADDVQVIDAEGQPVAIRRNGTQWHRLFFSVAPKPAAYFVQAVDPLHGKPRPQLPAEEHRNVTDPVTGLRARVCEWYDGRRAALSIRFDDSHPTHLSKAIPILREYGFQGTFMINPGNADYREQADAWEACARRGDQEFANHTMHHRGAAGEEEIDRELGDASKHIWSLFPRKSKLVALNLGGGTTWVTERPFQHYLDKYHLFTFGGSLGMDDVYGKRVDALRLHLERHIERGLWCRIHYHYIGDGLSTSEANFRAAMDVVQGHASQLWIAGMADVYKYQTERQATKLAFDDQGPRRRTLKLSCLTDPSLFDQPLTIELTLAPSWPAEQVSVVDQGSKALPARIATGTDGPALRFDARPIDGAYTIERRLTKE